MEEYETWLSTTKISNRLSYICIIHRYVVFVSHHAFTFFQRTRKQEFCTFYSQTLNSRIHTPQKRTHNVKCFQSSIFPILVRSFLETHLFCNIATKLNIKSQHCTQIAPEVFEFTVNKKNDFLFTLYARFHQFFTFLFLKLAANQVDRGGKTSCGRNCSTSDPSGLSKFRKSVLETVPFKFILPDLEVSTSSPAGSHLNLATNSSNAQQAW